MDTLDFSSYQIPAEREDRFSFRGIQLYMPRMAKAKTMLVGGGERPVAICTGWDDPELVLPFSLLPKIVLAAPIRSIFGVNIFLANLALNPQIQKVIFLRGGELDETEAGALPRRIINALWQNGFDNQGKIIGTDFSLLPELLEDNGDKVIKEIMKDVEITDWSGKDEKSLQKLAEEINSLKKTIPQRQPFTFKEFKVEEIITFPSERTALEIREKTPAEAWLRLLDRIIRYGHTATLETKEGTLVREIPFVRVTVENLEEESFPIPQWLADIPEIQITPGELEDYYQRFIKPDRYYKEIYPGVFKFFRPPTDKYLYGELLFAFPRPKEIDKTAAYILEKQGISEVYAFLENQFPVDETKKTKANNALKDEKLENEKKAEILLEIFRPPTNQVAEICKRIKEIGDEVDKIFILWDPNVHSFLYSGRPCWVEGAALIRDDKLNFKAVFRSHDIAKGWLKNTYGIYRFIQEYLCSPAGLKIGTLTIESESGHIYLADLSWVKKLWQNQVEEKNVLPLKTTDPRGNLLISVEGNQVEVILVSPVEGRPLASFTGPPREILKQIANKDLLLEKSHWIYLGKELTRAEECLKKGIPYNQDKA